MKAKFSVNEGRVQCPRRGDVDIDVCLTCPQLSEVRGERGREVVVCSPSPKSPRDDWLYYRL